MIVVVIIGLLAALAIPAFQRVHRHSQNSAVVNGFRVFSQTFETYAMERGGWPPNSSPGQLPAALNSTDAVKVSSWKAVTPIGGSWNWDAGGTGGVTAGISISNYTASDAQLMEIDAMIDDGDLTTGRVQKIISGTSRFSYILEE